VFYGMMEMGVCFNGDENNHSHPFIYFNSSGVEINYIEQNTSINKQPNISYSFEGGDNDTDLNITTIQRNSNLNNTTSQSVQQCDKIVEISGKLTVCSKTTTINQNCCKINVILLQFQDMSSRNYNATTQKNNSLNKCKLACDNTLPKSYVCNPAKKDSISADINTCYMSCFYDIYNCDTDDLKKLYSKLDIVGYVFAAVIVAGFIWCVIYKYCLRDGCCDGCCQNNNNSKISVDTYTV
jgi:hypothetical protein